MQIRKFRSVAFMSCAAVLFGIGGAYAATQTVTSTIKFFSDLSITQTTAPNFGAVKAATAGVYVLSTAGAVTPSGGGVIEGGTPVAGSYTIKGSSSGLINISATGYTAQGQSTPSAATCTYNSVAVAGANCTGTGLAAPGAAGLPLLVGLTVTTTASTTDSETDTPSFTLNVVYQ